MGTIGGDDNDVPLQASLSVRWQFIISGRFVFLLDGT